MGVAPYHYAAAPTTAVHYTAAAAPVAPAVAAAHTVVAGLTPHDCVTEAGCALRAALLTGAPAATFGSASVAGRKRRDADADAAYLYSTAYNGLYGAAFPYAYNSLPYSVGLPYNNFYNYNPLSYLNNYYAAAPA